MTRIDLDLSDLTECILAGRLRVGGGLGDGWHATLSLWNEEGPIDAEQVDEAVVAADGTFSLIAPRPGRHFLVLDRADAGRRIVMAAEVELREGTVEWRRELDAGRVEGRLELANLASRGLAFGGSEGGGLVLTTSTGDLFTAVLLAVGEDGEVAPTEVPAGASELRYTPLPPAGNDPRDWTILGRVRVVKGELATLLPSDRGHLRGRRGGLAPRASRFCKASGPPPTVGYRDRRSPDVSPTRAEGGRPVRTTLVLCA